MDFPNQGSADRCLHDWLEENGESIQAQYAYVRVGPSVAGSGKRRPIAEQTLLRLLRWQQRLLAAVRPQELLSLLNTFGLSDRDLVRAARGRHLSTRTLRRWKLDGFPESKADERWEQLDDLRAIIGFMLADGTYDEEGIVAWLRSRQPDLELQRPLDVLGEGRFDDVLRSAERTLAPAPGKDTILKALDDAPNVETLAELLDPQSTSREGA